MGIPVTCPNGHTFKVKEKYAGKKGLCPFCPDQVAIRVPDAASSANITQAAYRAAAEQHGGSRPDSSTSIFDDHGDQGDASTSTSLVGSSAVRHNVKCVCGEHVPMWFAKCPKCGHFLDHR
jgi:hypothetical protein